MESTESVDVVEDFLREVEQADADTKNGTVDTVVEGVRRLGQRQAEAQAWWTNGEAEAAADEARAAPAVDAAPAADEAPEAEKPKRDKYIRTIYVGREELEQIASLQEAWKVDSLSGIIRWLLWASIEGLEEGTIEPPVMEDPGPRAVLWED